MNQGHDLSGIMAFTQRDKVWAGRLASVVDEHILPAMEEFDLDIEDLSDLLGEQLPWTLWGCAFEDFLSRRWEPTGETIVDVYLKRRGWSEKALNRAYIEGLRDAWVSLHEVTEVIPGESMKLRDLLTGDEPVTVREKSATRSLKQWDQVAVRVVPVRDHHVISGGVLPFAGEVVDLLFEGLRDALRLRRSEAPQLSVDQLRRSAPLFSNAFLLTHLPRTMDPQSPHLTNTYGEDLEFHELRFPFAAGVLQGQIVATLEEIPELSPNDPKSWNWLAPKQPRAARKGKGKEPGLALETFADGGTILGMLEIKGKTLLLRVNSKERAARGAKLIETAAGGLLRSPLTTIQTVEQLMQERRARSGRREDAADDVPPEIARQIMQEHFDRHYRDTLDLPVPALGGKTPRQAVRSAAGRKQLVEWLKLLENSSARNAGTPMAEYDFRWMLEELGVLDQRE